MPDGQDPSQQKSGASTAATHVEVELPPLLVSPAVAGEFNTVRSSLIPKACFSLEDSHFEFDSSFVFPMGLTFDAGPLKNLLDKHPGFKLSIFGHTDPVGKDDYNKVLSGRRAQAVFGLLVRDVKLWEDLYFHHDTQGKDKWGVKAIQAMLNFAGPTKAGAVNGVLRAETRNALKDFEIAQGLPTKGFNQKEEIDPGTFRVLAPLYMDAICLDDDGNKFQLTPDDFLARGKGKDGKGDFQGCGEFNPLMMFSNEERKFLDKDMNKPQRNKENQPNRRIMILLYRPGSRIDPAKWPCPTVKEGVAGCILRFHSNAKDRRSNLDERREHKDEKDKPDMVGTFACRFYDRQTNDSPCERVDPATRDICFVFLKLFDDSFNQVLANTEYTLRGAEKGFRVKSKTDTNGIIRHENIPDDHYELRCGDSREVVEPFYLSDKPLHDDNPWFMRIASIEHFEPVKVRLYDPSGKTIPDAPCEINVGDKILPVQKAEADGTVTIRNVALPTSCHIRWGPKPKSGEKPMLIFSLKMELASEDSNADEEAKRKLNNLGYASSEFSDNVADFQREYGHLADPPLDPTGAVDERTMSTLRQVYEQCADDLKKK